MSKLSGKPVTPLYLRSSMVYLSFLLNYSLSLSHCHGVYPPHTFKLQPAPLSLSQAHTKAQISTLVCTYLSISFTMVSLSLSLSHFSYKLNFLYCNLYLYILHFNNFSIVFLSLSLSSSCKNPFLIFTFFLNFSFLPLPKTLWNNLQHNTPTQDSHTVMEWVDWQRLKHLQLQGSRSRSSKFEAALMEIAETSKSVAAAHFEWLIRASKRS